MGRRPSLAMKKSPLFFSLMTPVEAERKTNDKGDNLERELSAFLLPGEEGLKVL